MGDTHSDPASRVLIVDDDIALRGITATHLRKAGYEVEVAPDGEQGLAKAIEFQPDVLVSDIMMPVMDGVTLVRKVREVEALSGAYIILLTAKDRTTDMVEGFEATADDYITKPFKMAELAMRVRAGARLKTVQDRLRETNAALSEALRQRAQLLGMAAHDLRNPINIITTYISLLGQDIVSQEDIKEVCLRRAKELVGLIDNLLDMTKIDAGLVNLNAEEVEIGSVVAEVVSLFTPVAQQKQVAIERACPQALTLICDGERVQEMLNVLMQNAIQLSPAGRPVVLTVEAVGTEVWFRMQGQGGGFAPGTGERLFEPPGQRQGMPDGYDTNSLLGLAIVKKLAERMGGTVSADSGGMTGGATFGFELPRAAGESVAEVQARYAALAAAHEGKGEASVSA